VFENRMLRNIFGPKRVQVIGSYRKLHNEEIHDLYSWSNTNMSRTTKCRRMQGCGLKAYVEKQINAYRVMVGKPGRKRPLRGHRH
jgi:hypothetical protein